MSKVKLFENQHTPNAEPFKLWLAQVGYERLEENEDPELTIDRALATYLAKENLSDNMSNLELVLNRLAEATTTEISKELEPQNFDENKQVAQQGGEVAGNARKDIESKTGKKVVTAKNANQFVLAGKKSRKNKN